MLDEAQREWPRKNFEIFHPKKVEKIGEKYWWEIYLGGGPRSLPTFFSWQPAAARVLFSATELHDESPARVKALRFQYG